MSTLSTFVVSTIGAFLPMVVPMRRGTDVYEKVLYSKWLHVYMPRIIGGGGMVVFVHGGGWIAGSIEEDCNARGDISYAVIGHSLASRGVPVALIGYPRCAVGMGTRVTVYVALAVFAYVLAVLLGWLCMAVGATWLSRTFWHVLSAPCYAWSAYLLRSRALSPNQDPAATFAKQRTTIRTALSDLGMLYPEMRLVVVGHSAGAHMVALEHLTVYHTAIKHVVLLSGPFDLTALQRLPAPQSWIVRRILLDPVFRGVDLKHASPQHLVAASKTPACHWTLVTAWHDNPLLVQQTEAMRGALVARGETFVGVWQDVGVGHGAGLVFNNALWDRIAALSKTV